MRTVRHNDITADWPALEPIFLVRDVEASVAFYRDRLGFAVEARWEDDPGYGDVVPGAIVSSRGVRQFSGFANLRIRLQQLDVDQPLPAPGAIVLIHVADRLDQLAADYRERGVRMVSELTRLADGTLTLAVCDPNGHILHFAEPGAPVGARLDGEPRRRCDA